ncbi:catalase HPII, partial [Acinetobacter sp. 11520]|nr:catalase HPII [Acinetobacter sp. 11520]
RQVQQILANIDLDLARQVGANLGIEVPDLTLDYKKTAVEKSAKLSFLAFPPQDIQGRKVAVLIHNLVKSDSLEAMKNWAIKEGVTLHLLAPSLAPVKDHQDSIITADGMQMAEPSIAYDAVIIPDGDNLNAVLQDGVARHYLLEAYKHLKPIAFLGNKSDLLEPL